MLEEKEVIPTIKMKTLIDETYDEKRKISNTTRGKFDKRNLLKIDLIRGWWLPTIEVELIPREEDS